MSLQKNKIKQGTNNYFINHYVDSDNNGNYNDGKMFLHKERVR